MLERLNMQSHLHEIWWVFHQQYGARWLASCRFQNDIRWNFGIDVAHYDHSHLDLISNLDFFPTISRHILGYCLVPKLILMGFLVISRCCKWKFFSQENCPHISMKTFTKEPKNHRNSVKNPTCWGKVPKRPGVRESKSRSLTVKYSLLHPT